MDYITATYSILPTVTRISVDRSDPRYEVIAYLSYSKELLVIAMAMEDDNILSLPMCIPAAAKMIGIRFFAAKMAEGLQVHAALHPVEVPIHR